jgi:hypothetical protein
MSPARFAANDEAEALLIISYLAALVCLSVNAFTTFCKQRDAEHQTQKFRIQLALALIVYSWIVTTSLLPFSIVRFRHNGMRNFQPACLED